MTRRCLAIVLATLLLASVQVHGQGPETFRTLASFTERLAGDPHVSPDGRFVLFATRSELRVLNLATRQSSKLVDGETWSLAWSPNLDRIAWVRGDADGKGQYVWTMPIDPKTASSRGPAQRVTMGRSNTPAISPDGKWIAFQAPDSGVTGNASGLAPHHVSIVSVTGGPEQVIASFDATVEGENWSADSKSLFVSAAPRGLPAANLSRIYLDGRPPQIIRRDKREWFPGMTSDHAHIVVVPSRNPIGVGDEAIVLDTTGKELGRAQLPVGTIHEYDAAIDSSLVWVWLKTRHAVDILGPNGTAPKRVSVGETSASPVWSPDGKRIAFQVRENNHNVLALMNADGSGVQVLHDAVVRGDQWGARWSPDSKTIGYTNPDWHEFRILDVATRVSRTILKDSTRRVGLWTWRPDSKSVAAIMIVRQSPASGSIDEITTSGSHKKLVDFGQPAIVPSSGFQFIDGSTAFARADSVAYVIPLDGGAQRRLTAIPQGTRAYGTAVSSDHRLIASPILDEAHGELNQVEVLSVESGERRVVRVPFQMNVGFQPIFTDNDRALLVFGRAAGDTTGTRLYSVPLNGGAPRSVASVGDANGASVSPSPDGKSVAYTVQAERTTSLLLVDLRAILTGKSASTKRDHNH
jgi:Tol biopolymer transport system component